MRLPLWVNRLVAAAVSVLTAEPTEEGGDVSHWQRLINWPKLATKWKYVYIKATQRLAVDDRFAYNFIEAKKTGILRGVYHFLTPDLPGAAQARFAIQKAIEIGGSLGELPLMVDVEVIISAQIVFDFCDTIHRLLGYWPVIYTSQHAIQDLIYGDMRWAKVCPLMVASWDSANPRIPAPWTTYVVWQYHVATNGPDYGVGSPRLDLSRAKKSWLDQYRQPQPGDNDMAAKEKVIQAKVLLEEALAQWDQPAPPAPPTPPTPTPPPANTATYRVTEEKAIANYTRRNNGAGYPMMEQIPQDEREGQPFKNLHGQTVKVYRQKINADGNVDFFMVYGTVRKGTGEPLYLSKADGGLID